MTKYKRTNIIRKEDLKPKYKGENYNQISIRLGISLDALILKLRNQRKYKKLIRLDRIRPINPNPTPYFTNKDYEYNKYELTNEDINNEITVGKCYFDKLNN